MVTVAVGELSHLVASRGSARYFLETDKWDTQLAQLANYDPDARDVTDTIRPLGVVNVPCRYPKVVADHGGAHRSLPIQETPDVGDGGRKRRFA